MTSKRSLIGVFMLFVAAIVTGCGGGGDDAPPAAATSASAVIGPAGGTLTGPDGVQVVVPAGALSGNTTIGIARNAAGAPAPLQEGNAPAGPIYEFTPHDVVFNVPVTIRIPVPANAASSEVFMASLGGDWMVNSATLNGAFAEWQRNSFSFGMAGLACAIPAGSTDPYPCSYPSGGARVTATPSAAIAQIVPGWLNFQSGSAGSWRVNPPGGTISVTLHYRAAPDCSAAGGGGLSGRVRLIRWNPADPLNTPGRVTTVFDQPVALTQEQVIPPVGTMSHGGGPTFRGVGSTTVDVSSHLADATNVFGFTFSCQRPGRPVHTGGDLITIIGPMAAPVGSFIIGGTASGLTGAGLVLRNNGGDDRAVTADGAFTFATAIGVGAPYAVSVLTQPAGQTCTVQNGSGTAQANVTNVAVSCVASPVFYTVGGTVSGLTGTGLVLQNNGGDNRAVTADGAFTFATAIGVGAPYAVSVLTQPAGQTCTVQNGSGTANANVTNVAVSCVASPVSNWGAAVAISDAGKNAYEPALGASIDGYTTLAWVQHDTDQYNGYASRFDPATGWLGSELIENLATNTAMGTSSGVYSPRVAMGANQRAHIVFGFSVQGGSYHTGMSRYTGSAWDSQMLTFGGNSNDAALSFTGDGNTALMMYSQHDGVSRYAIRSQAYQYGNNTLASLSPEGSATFGSSNSPAAAALGSSDAVGTWIAQGQFVYINRFDGATQTWGVPVNLNASSTGNAYPHAIAGNAGGNAAVVWLDLNSGYRVYASRLSGATWSTPVTLATQAEGAPRNFNSSGVSVATGLDTSGNAYFAWGQEDLASPFTIRLYVSRCAIGQPMSACESRIQMDTRNDRMGRPGMAVAPNGDVWVAWVARTAAGSEVRIRQRNSTGWSAVVTLGSSSDTDVAPSIAIDGLNRVTVAWEGADSRIYVVRHQ